MQLEFITAYHPQTNGQIERVNRVLEDMLRMQVMHRPKQWEEYLPLVEFAYNNGYQESLKMSPFKTLYGRKSKVLISWGSLVEKITLGPKLLKEMEQAIVKIR
jgi:transposase InsO family protein